MSTAATPLVSIVIRSMDRASLDEALQSVAAQAHPSIEIVVVNARGPGHRPLPADVGGRPVRWVDHGTPLPRARAANAGLDAATGSLIGFLDDDDVLFPDHVSVLVQALADHRPLRCAYANTRVEFLRDAQCVGVVELNDDFDRSRLWGRNFLPFHAVLFERSLLTQQGCRIDETLEVYEDWDFWTQLSQHTDFVHVDRTTCCYRNSGGSGFGLTPDEALILRGKERYFEKWRLLWSGAQVRDLVDWRETLLDERRDQLQDSHRQAQEQQQAAEQRVAALNESAEQARLQFEQTKRQLDHELQGTLQALASQTAATLAVQEQVATLDGELARSRLDVRLVNNQLDAARAELRAVLASRSWRMTAPYRNAGTLLRRAVRAQHLARAYIADHGGLLRGGLRLLGVAGRVLMTQGPHGVLGAARAYVKRLGAQPYPAPQPLQLSQALGHPLVPHVHPVDIVVCVHNALDDVKACLDSVQRHTAQPYRLILVDDGSQASTRDFLIDHAHRHGATLLRNEEARGYTVAANQGMRQSAAPYLVLLNSDTVVSTEWVDRMMVCAESDPKIGIVGPLSNTASWQSIPEIARNGDWSDNPLPPGMAIDDMARWVADTSGQTYPRLGFLNGFCLLIKRELLDRVGLFDEEAFPKGYGEENDLSLRTGKAGFTLAVADDVYVFHAQSKSYSTERRRVLSEAAGIALAKKHGQPLIDAGVHVCRFDRTMQGIRAHAASLFERHALSQRARSRWASRRVIFVLPVQDAGGGANIILCEARAMRRMGVDVHLLNFEGNRAAFETGYPELDIPVHYAADEGAVAGLCAGFDAVFATLNTSVFWIEPLRNAERPPVLGYYVQDFEPQFYRAGSPGYDIALRSYTAIPEMVCVTKTRWNAETVLEHTGRRCAVIGVSYDVDLFMPRPRSRDSWPQAPLRIAAMIRPSTPRRSPLLTMQVLKGIVTEFGAQVEVILFGVDASAPEFKVLPHDFPWNNAGMLTPPQMALLLNEADVFVDFSQYQAMGLTALEAMACGAAVIVPEAGGADGFAIHERNALFVDTTDAGACFQALRRLLTDHELRQSLQQQASVDVAAHVPERPAALLLEALFG